MSLDPSSYVTNPKDVAAAQASANELKAFIATSRGEMRRVASNLSAESSLGSLRRRALEGIRSEKVKTISELAKHFPTTPTPDFRSATPYPHAGPAATQTGGGWVLDPVLARAFDEAAQAARSSLNVPTKRTMADRLFRDLDGTRLRSGDSSIEIMSRVVASVTAAIGDLEVEAQRVMTGRHAEAQALRQRAEERLTLLLNKHADIQARLPAPLLPWPNDAWEGWHPSPAPSEVYAGQLRPRHDQTLGEHGDFGRDVVVPLYVRPTAGLHLVAQRASRPATHELVRALLVRSLAAHAPGTLHLTVFDPIGLGQAVAPLLDLAEYDQELLGGKIWSNAADFKTRMRDLTAHVELVVQKFLRSDYATLAEFNMAAGEIAAPYRLLVVFDFPTQFDQESFGELRRIIETGPRCGVSTLLVTNGDEPLPHGMDLESLPKTMTRINMAAPFSFAGPNGYDLICDFDPDSDRALPIAVLVEHQATFAVLTR